MKNIRPLYLPTIFMIVLLFATSLQAAPPALHSSASIGSESPRQRIPVATSNARVVGTAPSLGGAASFAVLAGSTITNTGASQIIGDVGVSPGTAITGLTPGMVVGDGDAAAAQAQTDALAAFNNLAGQACDIVLTGQDLGGLTLTPGVYCFSSSAQLSGTLTLDALGDTNAVFVFQIGSTLTTASNSAVLLINSGNSCNVFYQVGSSATFGTDTSFQGNILARESITLNTRTGLNGRVLALDGAVTMDTNNVSMQCDQVTTAASVSISGRVLSADGRGIRDARVWITDSQGFRRMATTSSLGYYSFDDVEAGDFFIIEAVSKRFRFGARSVSATDSIAHLDFLAMQ